MENLIFNSFSPEVLRRFEFWTVIGEGGGGIILRVRDRVPTGDQSVNANVSSRGNFKAIKVIRKHPKVPIVEDDFFGTIPLEAWIMLVCQAKMGILGIDWIYQDKLYWYLVLELPRNTTSELERRLFDQITSTRSPTGAFTFNSSLLNPFGDLPFRLCVQETAPDLFEFVEDNFPLPEEKVKDLILQIATTLDFLHSHGLFHGDLKDENILVDETGTTRIIDFGASREKTGLQHGYNGTINYTAPETLMGKLYDPMKADVWALGVILYILTYGQRPFQSREDTVYKNPILGGIKRASKPLNEIIIGALQKDPLSRFSIDQMLKKIRNWIPPHVDAPVIHVHHPVILLSPPTTP